MEEISKKDRERLRFLAEKQMNFANCAENDRILKQWEDLKNGIKGTPTVRLLFSNFPQEVIYPRMECEGKTARNIERKLLWTMVGRELFCDDTPISPTFDIEVFKKVSVFGTRPNLVKTGNAKSNAFHIEPVVEDLTEDFDKLKGGTFTVDRKGTEAYKEVVNSVIGDILPVRMVMNSLCGAITNPLVALMGMENYYMAMYDTPDELHAVMDMATTFFENYYDFLEKEQLLEPTCDISPVNQESFAFNSELPTDKAVKTTDCWGFLESQETTAVSPETFGEFVFPYQDRLVKRFGLLSYGCCERVDATFENYLSKWKNLRKLSVSPFNNENRVGEYLRGTNIVYYSKPRAEYVTNRGPLDENAVEECFKRICEASSGCLFEVAQREVGTIYGDFERGRKYVEIAKRSIEKYWKP